MALPTLSHFLLNTLKLQRLYCISATSNANSTNEVKKYENSDALNKYAGCNNNNHVRPISPPSLPLSLSIPNSELLQYACINPIVLRPCISQELLDSRFDDAKNLVRVEDMFNARVHYGHKIGTLNENMKWALFGERLGVCIFDLDITRQYFTKALSFLAQLSFSRGLILFITSHRGTMQMVEQRAEAMGHYSHTRKWELQTLTNWLDMFGAPIRLPDTIVFMNTMLTSQSDRQHPAITEAAKMTIPTVAICDSNADLTNVTYPIPGNDDSPQAVEYYLEMIGRALEIGRRCRERIGREGGPESQYRQQSEKQRMTIS